MVACITAVAVGHALGRRCCPLAASSGRLADLSSSALGGERRDSSGERSLVRPAGQTGVVPSHLLRQRCCALPPLQTELLEVQSQGLLAQASQEKLRRDARLADKAVAEQARAQPPLPFPSVSFLMRSGHINIPDPVARPCPAGCLAENRARDGVWNREACSAAASVQPRAWIEPRLWRCR